MSLFSKLLGKGSESRGSIQSNPQYVAVTTEMANQLVRIINESMHLANDSKNIDTKVSRLNVAKDKLEELKKLAEDNSFLKLERLSQVEACIQELETEFSIGGYQQIANSNMQGELLEREGNIEAAIKIYEHLLEKGVDTPFTYQRLAIIYGKAKNRSEELRVIKAALKNIPESNSNHYKWFSERMAKKFSSE